MPLINFEKYNVLMDKSYTSQLGKVAKVVGLTIESIGPSAKLNDLCLIRSNNRTEPVKAWWVFHKKKTMPTSSPRLPNLSVPYLEH